MAPTGRRYAPDKAISIDMSGNTVEGTGQVERSAFQIHSGLHRTRPDLHCFLHAHLTYATALSMLVDNRLKAYGQQSLRFHSGGMKRGVVRLHGAPEVAMY